MARRPDLGYYDEGADLTAPSFLTAQAGLPPLAYRSLHFSYLEDEVIWSKDWVAIGSVFDIPEAGDLLPYTAGYHGIHVQRQDDGSLIGRFNMAQHGGCRVVPAQCQNGAKTQCSFTSCGYSRDQKAISHKQEADSPRLSHQYLGLRPERLNPVAVSRLGSVIMVNLDPGVSAEPCPGEGAQAERQRHTSWIECEANWKVLAEAMMRGDGQSAGPAYKATRQRQDGAHLRVEWTFPNLIRLTSAESQCVLVLQPVALKKTLMRVETLSARSATPSEPWLSELNNAGAYAAHLQTNLNTDMARIGPVQIWVQEQIAARILAMPKPDFAFPISQPMRSYLR